MNRNLLESALADITFSLGSSSRQGTGFLVAPDLVLTCAHVLCGAGERPPEKVTARWKDAELDLEIIQEWYKPGNDGGPDLALLRIQNGINHPRGCLSAAVQPGDTLWAFGYPDGPYRTGDSVMLRYDGRSRRVDGAELLRVTQGRVLPGFSGSPVLNWRTGGICGLLRLADRQPGAVSGARLIPISVVLRTYPSLAETASHPSADSTWIGLLEDDQIRSGGWRYPGPVLRGYLEAAREAAREHPYSIALPNAPSLAAVYLRQQLASPEDDKDRARQRSSRAETGTSQAAPSGQLLSIDEALIRHRCGLVVGGPGAGKSSLLRHMTQSTASSLLDGHEERFVPVRISAQALTGSRPFPEIIKHAVITDLGATIGELPDELFAHEALPGIPWLVLVDGLDEITDRELRRQAIRVLARWWNESAYRFLVASRPLLDDELVSLRAVRAAVLTIEPFNSDQLPELAIRWFAALQAGDTAQLTERFLDHLERSRLGQLARIPLIATMACVVFADDQTVPPGRFALYSAFVARLLDDPRKRDTLTQQLLEELRPYAAEASIRRLVQDRRKLLERLGYARRLDEGSSKRKSFQELVKEWTQSYKPDDVPDQRWSELIIETIRQSGLVVQRDGDLAFFHQTIQEYLAACYQAAIFQPTRRRVTSNLQLRNRNTWDDWDVLPTPELFLAAAWMTHSGRLPKALPKISPNHRLTSCLFVAALARDGITLSGGDVKHTIDELTRMTGIPWWSRCWIYVAKTVRLRHRWRHLLAWRYNRVRAAKALVLLDQERGIAALAALAADPTLIAGDARIEAATVLASFDQRLSLDALSMLAGDATFDLGYRPEAARQVAEFDSERGKQILTAMISDPTLPEWARSNSAIDLIWLEHERDVDRLIGMISDRTVDSYARARAAADLGRQGTEQAAQALAAYAADSTVDSYGRVDAAESLAAFAPELAAGVLTTLVSSPTMDSYPRLLSARTLAALDGEQGVQALLGIVNDAKADSDDRRLAAEDLAELNPQNGLEKLSLLAADPTMKRAERWRARRAAHELKRDRSS